MDSVGLDRGGIQKLSRYFIDGNIAGAIEYMKNVPALCEVVIPYIDIFEKEHYLSYDVPDEINSVLLVYQQYFRDVFYLHADKATAEKTLFDRLGAVLSVVSDEALITEKLTVLFEVNGYHIQCGKTNGYYGPYVWKETTPVTYTVELPDGKRMYTVNILRGFVMRGWMAYLTFDEKGTGGWTSSDGTINCIEKAYDFGSEKFTVSLLKHEAQHAEDMTRWTDITPAELEYRAKLVELIYTEEREDLLGKFISEAGDNQDDSHAAASAKIKREFGSVRGASLETVRQRAQELFESSTAEMIAKYER